MSPTRLDRIERLQRELAEARIRQASVQARLIRLRRAIEEGRFVSRNDVETDLAQRASVFRSMVKDVVHTETERLVKFVNGDPDRVAAAIERLMDVAETWFDQFAEDREWSVYVPSEPVMAVEAARREVFGNPSEKGTDGR